MVPSLPTILSQTSRSTESVIVLSPHFDDAVWSIGGILARLGARSATVLATAFGRLGPQYSRIGLDLLNRAGLDPRSAQRQRTLEDQQATAALDVKHFDLGLQDAVSRMPDAYGSRDQLAGSTATVDRDDPAAQILLDRITELIVQNERVILLAPDGRGHHVDHQVCRGIAEQVTRLAEVWLYTEFPYSVWAPDEAWTATDDSYLEVILTSSELRAHIAASHAYQSQIQSFFPSQSSFDEELIKYLVNAHTGRPEIRLTRLAPL